ncbi:hypothetical protein ACFQJC_15975 [Haloferax namakaokahaiae]|uniref:Uncharacterized protein n=1 Tax=Haloferax namakaokahaiae TaxID=1748331 RepID=A0ABD5ZJ08_9EURY
MVSLESAVRQVGDFVVIALFFFGLLPIFAPLDLLLPALGYHPPVRLQYVVAGAVGALLLWLRPLRLRLVVRVWIVGLTMSVLATTLFIFFDLRGDPLGILAVWGVSVGLGLALAYPPLWKAAEARLRVE